MKRFAETTSIVKLTNPLALLNVFKGVILFEIQIILNYIYLESFLLVTVDNTCDRVVKFLLLFYILRNCDSFYLSSSKKLFECGSDFLAHPVPVRHYYPHQLLDRPFKKPAVSFFNVAYYPLGDFIFFFLAPLRVFCAVILDQTTVKRVTGVISKGRALPEDDIV